MAKYFVGKFISFIFLIGLVLSISVPVYSSDRLIPDKPQTPQSPQTPVIRKIEFIHYPRTDTEIQIPRQPRRSTRIPRPTPPSAPTPPPISSESAPTPTETPTPSPTPTPTPIVFESACPDPLTCDAYGLTGLFWHDANGADDLGIPYYINVDESAGLESDQVQTALTRSFLVWEQANTAGRLKFQDHGTTHAVAGVQDFQNTISFVDFNRTRRYRGALAVTGLWYNVSTGEIVESDIAFNSSVSWRINPWPVGCSEYPIDTCVGDPFSYDFENTAVHEIGHTLMLQDLGNPSQQEMTMYGSARRGELKKRTLGYGDRIGLNLLYP